MRVAPEIVLTDEERAELTRLVGSKLTSVRLMQRARIVLLAAEGFQNKDIATQLGVGRVQVARWRAQ
jgi:DNA-binding NarL/FixJ family response regulator